MLLITAHSVIGYSVATGWLDLPQVCQAPDHLIDKCNFGKILNHIILTRNRDLSTTIICQLNNLAL